jgi:hypothetical protein
MGPPTFILMNLYQVHHPVCYTRDGRVYSRLPNCPETHIPATDDLSTHFICIPWLFRVHPPTREEELGRVLRTKAVNGQERIRAQKGDTATTTTMPQPQPQPANTSTTEPDCDHGESKDEDEDGNDDGDGSLENDRNGPLDAVAERSPQHHPSDPDPAPSLAQLSPIRTPPLPSPAMTPDGQLPSRPLAITQGSSGALLHSSLAQSTTAH